MPEDEVRSRLSPRACRGRGQDQSESEGMPEDEDRLDLVLGPLALGLSLTQLIGN